MPTQDGKPSKNSIPTTQTEPLSLPGVAPHLIARASRRIRILRGRRFGAFGLAGGAAVSVVLLVGLRLQWLDSDILADEWLLAPPILGLLGAALWGATRAIPTLPLLRFLEQSLDLKERLSTAHSFQPTTNPVTDAFAERQRVDAEQAAAQAGNLAPLFPLWPPHKREIAAATATVGAFLLYFLPTLPQFQSPAQRVEQQAVKKEGERIVQVARLMEKRATERKQENARRAAEKMTKLGEEMKKGRLTRQKALIKTAKLTEEMRQAQQAAAGQSSPKSLPSAARDLGKALNQAANSEKNPNDPTSANLNAPQNTPGPKATNGKSAQANADALKQMQQAMAQNNTPSLAEQLSRLADQTAQGHPDDKAGREDLAAKVDSLSKSLEGTSLSKASEPLRQASEALRSGNLSKSSEKLREASRRVSESAKQGEEAQSMQQMADALSGSDGKSDEGEMSDAGEGTGQDDAFNKNGVKKGHHVHTKECLQPGGT